jgi:hypothetical protein
MKKYYAWYDVCGRLSPGRLIEINSKWKPKRCLGGADTATMLKICVVLMG